RRISPALLFVVGVVACIGAVFFTPQAFEGLSREVVYSVLATTNFFFRHKVDYFGVSAEHSPLLHTWSLGVEEQFYLAFPILMVLLGKRSTTTKFVLLAVMAVVSFALCVWRTEVAQSSAFYLPMFRAWEFLIGVVLALAPANIAAAQTTLRNVVSVGGVALIAYAVLAFRDQTHFPGAMALIPCAGAGMVIWANGGLKQTWAGAILSSPGFVFIGKISYSLYLWHWPILVIWKYLKGEPLTVLESCAAVSASVVAAALTYYFIEQPFRQKKVFNTPPMLVAGAAVAASLIVAFGVYGDISNGWPQRFPRYAMPVNDTNYRNHVCFLEDDDPPDHWAGDACVLNPTGTRRVMLWGDSHAAHYTYGLGELAKNSDVAVVMYSSMACPPVFGARVDESSMCRAAIDNMLSVMERYRADTVIIAARWDLYFGKSVDAADVTQTIEALNRRGAKVELVSQSPTYYFSSAYDYEFITHRTEAHVRFDSSLLRELRTVGGEHTFWEPTRKLCHGEICAVSLNGHLIVNDDGHLTNYGSLMMAAPLLQNLPAQRERAIH
ncbi:MAG: acyltransferase family protein, partial [Caulobacterales bacterium]